MPPPPVIDIRRRQPFFSFGCGLAVPSEEDRTHTCYSRGDRVIWLKRGAWHSQRAPLLHRQCHQSLLRRHLFLPLLLLLLLRRGRCRPRPATLGSARTSATAAPTPSAAPRTAFARLPPPSRWSSDSTLPAASRGRTRPAAARPSPGRPGRRAAGAQARAGGRRAQPRPGVIHIV